MADASSSTPLGASRSIYYSLTDEVPGLGLTEEEKQKLENVMKKAMEFEAEEANKLRQPLEGQLYKYTNVMKGWQYRWFVVTPDTGMLEYYMLDERRKSRPRGALHLAGAVVLPSEEDNQSFVVSAVCGEMYKLKANDAKERQVWVDKVRTVIERHSSSSPEVLKNQSSSVQGSFAFCKSSDSNIAEAGQYSSSNTLFYGKLDEALPDKLNEDQINSITEIKNLVCKSLDCHKALVKSIEELPVSGPHIKCSDNKLLLIKAISQATVQSLEQCFLILKRQRQREALKPTAMPTGPSVDSLDKFRGHNPKQKEIAKNG